MGWHVQLTTDVHDELEAWRKLVFSLANRPTHLRELEPFTPLWIVTTDALESGMVEVCGDPEGQYFVWSSALYQATQARLVYSSNSKGYATIN